MVDRNHGDIGIVFVLQLSADGKGIRERHERETYHNTHPRILHTPRLYHNDLLNKLHCRLLHSEWYVLCPDKLDDLEFCASQSVPLMSLITIGYPEKRYE